MTAALIALETEDFVSAARELQASAAEPVGYQLDFLAGVLGGCSGMAGDDPGGAEWAASYDRAAGSALQAGQSVVNGVSQLARMFEQSARNYAAADAASNAATRDQISAALQILPAIKPFALPWCQPPSAAGGGGSAPHGWGLIEHLVGYLWPNGHPTRLRWAGTAWRGSADALQRAGFVVGAAPDLASAHRLPEAADMRLVCGMTRAQLSEVSDVYRSLGQACDQLADHIDEAHSAIEHELVSLIEWTVGIEGVGLVASILTAGTAEAPTQEVEATRIARTAARVATIIERFLAAARSVARTVAALALRADRLAASLTGLAAGRLTSAVLTQVQLMPLAIRIGELLAARRLGTLAGKLPEVVLSGKQLERKFKHAAIFGVTEKRGRAGFAAFKSAVQEFLAAPGTRRVIGVYRGKAVILSYSLKSRIVVIQRLDGTFVSGWKVTRRQILHVARDRRLGGG